MKHAVPDGTEDYARFTVFTNMAHLRRAGLLAVYI